MTRADTSGVGLMQTSPITQPDVPHKLQLTYHYWTEQVLVTVFSAKSLVDVLSIKPSSGRTVNQGQFPCCLESKTCYINIYGYHS
jgi:hypothetical protein